MTKVSVFLYQPFVPRHRKDGWDNEEHLPFCSRVNTLASFLPLKIHDKQLQKS